MSALLHQPIKIKLHLDNNGTLINTVIEYMTGGFILVNERSDETRGKLTNLNAQSDTREPCWDVVDGVSHPGTRRHAMLFDFYFYVCWLEIM